MARIKASLRRKPREQALRDAVYEYLFTTRKVQVIAAENQLHAREITERVKAAGYAMRSRRQPNPAEVEQLFNEGWSTARLRERFGLSKPEVNAILGVRTLEAP